MKKILSMALVLILTLSCLAVTGVSATEEFVPSDEPIIYFEVPDNWTNYSKIYCHIWEYNGEPLAGWQTKKTVCTETETKGTFSFDISKVGGLLDDTMYAVIFSSDKGSQTYDCLMDKNCFGDTLYCDGPIIENPSDSSKNCQAAFWKHQDRLYYGPVLQITSIGNVTGTALPPGTTVEDVVINFVTGGNLENALKYAFMTEEEIFAGIAEALRLSDAELKEILDSIGYTIGGTATPDEATPDEATKDEGSTINLYLGDADLSGGTITVKDATIIQKYIAGFEVAIELTCADVDQNNTVNVKDATTIQKFIASLPVDAPIGLLLGELPDKESGLDSRLFGSWEGTVDAASVINMLLPMFSEDPLVLEHINIESCPIKQIYTFKDDGTYSLTVNEAALAETIATVKIELKGDIENFLKAYAKENNITMTPEQMIQAYGFESIDTFIEEMIPADMVAENTAPQEGNYNTVGNMLITQELLNTHETYTIEGDTLTIDIGAENFFPEMYPMVFTRVK